ncbi:MAG: lactonase family protein [Bacteroidota bacterium]
MKNKFLIFCIPIALLLGCVNSPSKTYLFIGSFTEGRPASGIHVYEFDVSSGAFELLYIQPNTINPSFLKISNDGSYLYSVLESQLPTNGKVAAFAIDSLSGNLNLLNIHDSGGRNPAHLSINEVGDCLINSNYTDAGISVFKIGNDGMLREQHQLIRFKDSGVIKGRQDAAHIHSTNFSPDGNFLFAQDLGADKIRGFKVKSHSQKGLTLEDNGFTTTKPGSGPRHFTFHPNGEFGYSIGELNGTINAYKYAKGNLHFIQDYPSYRSKQDTYRASDIHISPDGLFLYASNRGPNEDSIVIFSIDVLSGQLSLVGHEPTYGEHPRNFCISPSGNFLLVANQFTNNVVIFQRNKKTGKLTKLPKELNVENPSSLQMYDYRID